MPLSLGEWHVRIGTYMHRQRKEYNYHYLWRKLHNLIKKTKNTEPPEENNNPECNSSHTGSSLDGNSSPGNSTRRPASSYNVNLNTPSCDVSNVPSCDISNDRGNANSLTRSQCDSPGCHAVKERGVPCDVKSPGHNDVAHSESACATNSGSPTANKTNPVSDTTYVQIPVPRPYDENELDNKHITINLMRHEYTPNSTEINKTDRPEVGTSESYSLVPADVPGETDLINRDKEETSDSAPSGIKDESLDLSPKPRQDTTRKTEQRTSSIREVNMTNILLLRSGDVERNPGPNANPGSLTELELYLLADGMDPSDFRKAGLVLGFTGAQLSRFEKDKLGNSMEATYQMLYEWRKTVLESKARNILINKLKSIKLVQLADSVQKGVRACATPAPTLHPPLEENIMPKPKQEVKDCQVIQVQAYFRKYHATEIKDQERHTGDGNDEDEVQGALDEEDTLEDFQELELEEEKAVESGAPYARAISVLSRERIMMMKKKGKEKEIKVKSKFLMDGPWWIASFKAVKEGNVYICKGTPTYMLRNEKGQKGKSLLQQLLSYVFSFPKPGSAEDQMKQAFWVYFEKQRGIKKRKNYTFHQFFKALEDALKKETSHDDTTAIPIVQAAKEIMQRFDPSNRCFSHVPSHGDEEEKNPRFDLRYVYRCFKCPQLFKVLPLLMERVALSILSSKILRDLERLESVLKRFPEDLGFYTSMREHNWGTIEVSFQGFVNAGMIPPDLFRCTTNQDSAPPPSKHTLSVKMAKVLKLYDIVKSRCKEGKHTFLYESDMKSAWRRDACQNVPFGHIREEPFVELQNRKVVKIEEKTFHWSKYRRYEERLAQSMERLLDQHEAEPWTLPVEDFSEFNFDSYQQGAALHVCKNAMTVILGRGGCGKTYVVASVIKKYLDHLEEEKRRLKELKELSKRMQDGERPVCSEDTKEEEEEGNDGRKDEENDEDRERPVILLTAPTGRAASILKRRTGMEARTLHSVLGTARKSNPEEFIYGKVEILVVDECSLVPISVLSEVLSTLLNHSLKKVIFLGDQHQLPSIDPGNFLQDIIKVFQTTDHNFIQTLKKNHRTDEGGRLIVENARRIAEGKGSDLVYQPDRFELLETSVCKAGNGQDQMVYRLIRNKPQLQDHKYSQLVAFRNVDVENINKICCNHYAGHALFKKGRQHNHHIRDKICARKNSTIRILGRSNPKDEDQKKQEAGGSEVKADNQRPREGEAGLSKKKEEKKGVQSDRISNGDTFFIEKMREVVENGKKKEIVTLQSMDEEEGTQFDVDFKEMRTRSKLQYAWARTIHTFQGSEVDYIVYVLSPYSSYETWQHLYTAITRGCKGCIIVGTQARLQRVVETNPGPRQTSLARFLREIPRPNLGEVDPRTPERPAPENFSSSKTAKPNRGKSSRKRKVKSNTVPFNLNVPCLQEGDSTSLVDSEVPKKKSCAPRSKNQLKPVGNWSTGTSSNQ